MVNRIVIIVINSLIRIIISIVIVLFPPPPPLRILLLRLSAPGAPLLSPPLPPPLSRRALSVLSDSFRFCDVAVGGTHFTMLFLTAHDP